MASRILRNEKDLERWVNFLNAQPLPMTVSHAKGAKRTNPQNSTVHMWYAQIAAQTYTTPTGVKGQCKHDHGLPIMEAENRAWIEEWEPMYGPLPYEMKIKLFQVIPMTSLFTVKQMAAFMNSMQIEYRSQGIILTDPEALKYEQEFQCTT